MAGKVVVKVKNTGKPTHGSDPLPARPFNASGWGGAVGAVGGWNPPPAWTRPAPPAAAAPAAPATPAAGPAIDWDAVKAQGIAGLGATRDAQLGVLGGNRTRALVNYGFKDTGVDANADGINDVQIDFADPASKAAALQRYWTQAKNGRLNSQAARGGLYSGALARQQRHDAENEQVGYTQLGREVLEVLGGIAGQEAQVKGDYQRGVTELLLSIATNAQPKATAETPAPAAPAKVPPKPQLAPGVSLPKGSKMVYKAELGRWVVVDKTGKVVFG